jgi:hypothetical protein
MQCVGEDRSIYRRGARRWRKIYLVNDHKYQAKRFARTALCKVCNDRIWGLGRQGYKCLDCKIMVHKRCHKFIVMPCGHESSAAAAAANNNSSSNSSNARLNDSTNSIVNNSRQQQQQQQHQSPSSQIPTSVTMSAISQKGGNDENLR